jgi:quercetin dioxygenase-like cupin family protein
VVLDGTLVIRADGREEEIGPLDSVHLPKGTRRRVDNRSPRPATLLVIIANRADPAS